MNRPQQFQSKESSLRSKIRSEFKLRFLLWLLWLLLFVFVTTTLPALDNNRRLAIGLSNQYLIADNYQKNEDLGLGAAFNYYFFLKPEFHIGINLAYRVYTGDKGLHQLGYGLLLKHYLWFDATSPVRPYVSYGLLLNVNRRANTEGAGTAHDTRLTAGFDFDLLGAEWFADFSYHYSRLSFFSNKATTLDNLEFMLGYNFDFRTGN